MPHVLNLCHLLARSDFHLLEDCFSSVSLEIRSQRVICLQLIFWLTCLLFFLSSFPRFLIYSEEKSTITDIKCVKKSHFDTEELILNCKKRQRDWHVSVLDFQHTSDKHDRVYWFALYQSFLFSFRSTTFVISFVHLYLRHVETQGFKVQMAC